MQKSGQDLRPGEKEMIHHLLLSYANIAELGRMGKLVHHIHTGDTRPVQQSVRCIPPQHQGEVRKLLSEMLERGIIKPSMSNEPMGNTNCLSVKED